MSRQVGSARAHEFTYLGNSASVRKFVQKGYLVPVRPNRDFRLAGVSFPYARPAVKLFVERLGKQYRAACKEPLVVTSLTRPRSHQPRNSSKRSVHPTGMALDLRWSKKRACRNWLEKTLLSLEARGVLEATRERWPPHYHIAVFPKNYARYVARLERTSAPGTTEAAVHRVRSGETLWRIAQRYSVSVQQIQRANRLRSTKIRPGQRLVVPKR